MGLKELISSRTVVLKSGENKSLEKDAKRDGLIIQFEDTAPGTPQQNGRVERKVKTL